MYRRNVKLGRTSFVLALLTIPLLAGTICAQTTAFTYQGRLTDGGAPANNNYDLQFTLWDAAVGGTQQPQPAPATLTKPNVAVTGGVFSVLLDFGVSAFPGADRFLEVGVRPAGSAAAFTILSMRQQISSTPYAIRTLNATAADSLSSACVACVTDSQINSVAASKLTGTLPPSSVPGGSGNYVQNTTTQQANANFNISGDGTAAGTLSAGVQYNIGANRVLSIPGTNNLFAGRGAGQANTSGAGNVFAGAGAGQANTTGSNNSFYGFNAGLSNTGLAITNAGNDNAFFGANAGRSITVSNRNSFFGSSAGRGNGGSENSFFGYNAGLQSTTLANQNSFFGTNAGQNNTGSNNAFFGFAAGIVTANNFNSFFGSGAGLNNTTGGGNTFVGASADFSNANGTGSNNTAIGINSKIGFGNLTNATAIGANAFVGQSNTLVLGSIAGVNGATANTNVGIGTTNPTSRLEIAAQDGLKIIGFQPFLTLRDTNGGNKSAFMQGVNGDALLLTNSQAALVLKDVSGNVGIGTQNPSQLLHVNSGSGNAAALVQTPAGAFAQYQLKSGATNPWSVGTQDNFAGNALLFRNGSTDLMKILPNGNVTQPRDKSGFVKAMAFVDNDGSIDRCYNSFLTGSAATTVPCGFTTDHFTNGGYTVNFGFQVSDRFFSVTPQYAAGSFQGSKNFGANFDFFTATSLHIFTFRTDSSNTVNRPFMVIVY